MSRRHAWGNGVPILVLCVIAQCSMSIDHLYGRQAEQCRGSNTFTFRRCAAAFWVIICIARLTIGVSHKETHVAPKHVPLTLDGPKYRAEVLVDVSERAAAC